MISDSSAAKKPADTLADLQVGLDTDQFFRQLINKLSGTLEQVVGVNDAMGFISIVGSKIGDEIDSSYKKALQIDNLDRHQVIEVLLDLKRRIDGDFYVISEDDEKIVLGNKHCPFGKHSAGRPSLCMMTSNVFGRIASQNLGYARVELHETIARGDGHCHITIFLRPSDEPSAGQEYFRVE